LFRRARAEDWDIDASVRARRVGGALMRQEREGSKKNERSDGSAARTKKNENK
jgi:hypothetical protein